VAIFAVNDLLMPLFLSKSALGVLQFLFHVDFLSVSYRII